MEHLATLAANPRYASACDLRTDHEQVRLLLQRFSDTRPVDQRRDAMRLALDLFEVHTALEEPLYREGVRRATYTAIAGMMEQLEMTEPSGRLYLARGLELRQALESYLAREEDARLLLPANDAGLDAQDRSLLALHYNLVRDAQRMLRLN